MRRVVTVLCLIFGITAQGHADSRWIRMESEKFDFYTSSGERSSRATLRHFEEIRQFFGKAMGSSPSSADKVRIIAFKSAKEFEPYRPGTFAAAYYLHGNGKDVIVLSGAGADVETTAVHEYIHLLVHQAGLKLPPWLNEGIAELYSTMKPQGDGVLVGVPLQGRLISLQRTRWVPLANILASDHSLFSTSGKDEASALYNMGWALTHMLAMDQDYRPKFQEFMKKISDGADSKEALESVYKRQLSSIEADLKAYTRADRYTGFVLPIKLERNKAELPETAVDPLDARIMLAELKSRVQKGSDGTKDLETLIADAPTRPEPYAALAYANLQEGRAEQASGLFAKAYDRGARDAKMLYDYGRLINGTDPKRSVEMFAHLIAAEPDNLDYRVHHAWALLASGDALKARITLAPLQKIQPKDAARFFHAMAAAESRLGNYEEALKVTRRWIEYEKDPQDRQLAQTQESGLQRVMEARSQGMQVMQVMSARMPSAQSTAPAGAGPEGRPLLQRRERPELEVQTINRQFSHAQGEFVRLDCQGQQARVVLRNHGAEAVFLIDDHEKVLIDDTSGLQIDLQCGKQTTAAKVEVMYLPAPDNAGGVVGVVRGLKRLQ